MNATLKWASVILLLIITALLVRIAFFSGARPEAEISANAKAANGRPEHTKYSRPEVTPADPAKAPVLVNNNSKDSISPEIIANDIQRFKKAENDLSQKISDLNDERSELVAFYKQIMSSTSDNARLEKLYQEAKIRTEKIQKEILQTNEQLGLVKAKLAFLTALPR